MKKLDDLQKIENEDEGLDALVGLASLCLKYVAPSLDLETLEDYLDTDTMYKVIEICGGVKLNDPNLLRASQELAAMQAAAPATGTP
jgi:hypothetical protein